MDTELRLWKHILISRLLSDKQALCLGEQTAASNQLISGNFPKQTVMLFTGVPSYPSQAKVSWNKKLTDVNIRALEPYPHLADTKSLSFSSPIWQAKPYPRASKTSFLSHSRPASPSQGQVIPFHQSLSEPQNPPSWLSTFFRKRKKGSKKEGTQAFTKFSLSCVLFSCLKLTWTYSKNPLNPRKDMVWLWPYGPARVLHWYISQFLVQLVFFMVPW